VEWKDARAAARTLEAATGAAGAQRQLSLHAALGGGAAARSLLLVECRRARA
jgi:hypothetical protein